MWKALASITAVALVFVGAAVVSPVAINADTDDAGGPTFYKDVLPIVQKNC